MKTAKSTADPLVSVRNLRVAFRLDRHTTFEAVKGISFDIPRNTHRRAGRRIGHRQVGHVARDPRACCRRRTRSSIRRARSSTAAATSSRCRSGELRKLRGADISMIFQEPMTSLNPVFTVGCQLEEVLRLHIGHDRTRGAQARGRRCCDEVGIPEPERRINAFPSQMSGGQQQRVMIAMAIACEPKLLIADEPTTALDVTIQKQILDLIAELQKRHQMSVLFITHDLAVVGEIADYVVVMRNGEIREQGPAKAVFETPQDAYTKALLQCRPQLDRRPTRLPVIDDFMHGDGPEAPGGPQARRQRRAIRSSST